MKKKIHRSMMLVLIITLAFSYVLFTFVTYRQTIKILQQEVDEEANYIATSLENEGQGYLEQIDQVNPDTRLTIVDPQGSVLYDSAGTNAEENHKDRPEVREAFKKGSGESIRMSGTVGKELYYYARLLKDGNVLRVSKSMNSLVRTAVSNLPAVLLIAAAMLLFAWLLSDWQTKKLIAPINALDVKDPLKVPIYEELQPLVNAIDTQNKEKDALVEMRKEFSANVSHELKTPLTSISGYAEIMTNGLVRPEDMSEFSERIYKEARHLITLVEDIIKLSKLDEESVELEKEDVELYELTREIVSRLSPQCSEKKISVALSGEPVFCHGIRQILDEMIYNITENAIKYNRDGGSVSVWVGNTLDGPKISVSDTGIGIPEEHQERIFERFYRVDKSHSKERGGTGLGLSIVKHGAILHGAKVTVNSEPGKGTKIEIRFPKEEKMKKAEVL